jgi:DnaJ-class molecular chaperone
LPGGELAVTARHAKKDFYEVLGIARDADGAEIKKAYRAKAMQHHPDRNPDDKESETLFKACAEAYEVLCDPQKRELYDRHGMAGSGDGFRLLRRRTSSAPSATSWRPVRRSRTPGLAPRLG